MLSAPVLRAAEYEIFIDVDDEDDLYDLLAADAGCGIHLARPCTYGLARADPHCNPVVWTLDRYSPAVIESLRGRTAIANAGLAYLVGKARFGSERFAALREQGASAQRLLWASTGTKNPAYSDVLYVEELIAPDTVNTMPPATYEAFRDHGVVEPRLERNAERATETLSRLGDLGIDLDAVTDELEEAGVRQFSDSFDELLATIGESRRRFLLGVAS